MWQYWLIIFMMQSFVCTASEKVQDKIINASHKKIMKWKKSLNDQERTHLFDLFKQHEQLYNDYKEKASLENKKALEQMHDVLENNMIPKWDSFYKPYVHVKMFDELYKTWKSGLNSDQVKKYHNILRYYENGYNAYLKNPNNQLHQRVLALQGQIQELMKS